MINIYYKIFYCMQIRISPMLVNCVNPASAFRHQGQSGTAGHGLVWHCPDLTIRKRELLFVVPHNGLIHDINEQSWNFKTVYGGQEPRGNKVIVPARQAI
jgi:hypothetical protein